jgi:hypothetical protein
VGLGQTPTIRVKDEYRSTQRTLTLRQFEDLVASADVEKRLTEHIDEWGFRLIDFIQAGKLDLPAQWDPPAGTRDRAA